MAFLCSAMDLALGLLFSRQPGRFVVEQSKGIVEVALVPIDDYQTVAVLFQNLLGKRSLRVQSIHCCDGAAQVTASQ